jgi:hypothetical protein
MIEGAILNIDGKLLIGDWNCLRTVRPTNHYLGCASYYVGEIGEWSFLIRHGFS